MKTFPNELEFCMGPTNFAEINENDEKILQNPTKS
jgi:hypothetical protein